MLQNRTQTPADFVGKSDLKALLIHFIVLDASLYHTLAESTTEDDEALLNMVISGLNELKLPMSLSDRVKTLVIVSCPNERA